MKVAMNNSPSKKYKFIKDYFLDGGGAIFKKDDIIVGKFAGNTIEHQNHSIPLEFVVEIPLENKSENDSPTSTQSFFQKNKTTLMFFGALAVSYLVYKKLK